MYEALIAHLRECAKFDKSNNTFKEAADAIEELMAALTASNEVIAKYRIRLMKEDTE